jgi:hypothetical protein
MTPETLLFIHCAVGVLSMVASAGIFCLAAP